MLCKGMKESVKGEVLLPDYNLNTIKRVLEYIYCFHVQDLESQDVKITEEEVLDLVATADKLLLQVQQTSNKLLTFLQGSIQWICYYHRIAHYVTGFEETSRISRRTYDY